MKPLSSITCINHLRMVPLWFAIKILIYVIQLSVVSLYIILAKPVKLYFCHNDISNSENVADCDILLHLTSP